MLGAHPALPVGAGDDCAVCLLDHSEFDQVFTTDPVIENVHFIKGECPERIGNKAVGRVLSDIAAMGANPQWMLVNVVASPDQSFSELEKIYEGINALCARFGATVIGGDLAQGPCLELHIFGTGLLPSGSALLRSGAQPGDLILITGPLGCSISGKHLDFVPRVEEGIFLRKSNKVNAMMDISDGLATDLRHILKQSGVGAILDSEQIPKNGNLEQALFDGEDFELLFTVPADNVDSLILEWESEFSSSLSVIGEITTDKGILKVQRENELQTLATKAFEHFSGK